MRTIECTRLKMARHFHRVILTLGKNEKDSHALNEKSLRLRRKQETKNKESLSIKEKNGLPTSWSTVPKMARFLQFEQPILINEKRENNVVS